MTRRHSKTVMAPFPGTRVAGMISLSFVPATPGAAGRDEVRARLC